MKVFVSGSEQAGGIKMNRAYLSKAARLFAGALFLLAAATSSSQAAALPTGFAEALVASGLSNPTAMAFAPDGRLFVCQQGGQLRVIKNGALLATPFLTVSTDSSGERGLLGIAFDPNFSTNQFIYIYYTVPTAPAHNRVSRFTASGDVAVAGSEVVILELDNLSGATNHNGGAMHFGADGKLYIAVGENATPSNSQTLANLLGKMLRINPDGTIPSDNPFFNQAAGRNRAIWALGLRNPFTFSVQPGTGRIFINDVGSSGTGRREEVNEGQAGANYGWPGIEGMHTNQPLPSIGNYRDPIYNYNPAAEGGCAITGGTFYNPPVQQFPLSYVGSYFFADFCAGWIRQLTPPNFGTASDFATGVSSPVDLKVGPDGNLYYLARGSGAVFRVFYTANQAPSFSAQPQGQTVFVGQPATFTVSANGTAPLTYQWQRNGVNIQGANSSSYTITQATLADSGARFRVIVTNAFGSATSNEVELTVLPSQPTVQFTSGSLSVGEGGGGLNLTVTRTGSTSAEFLVDYSAGGGTASERTDFTTLVGTLRFAPGETTKTLTFLVSEDAFVEGNETVNLTLSNPRGGALGGQSVQVVTITDNDSSPSSPNPIDQPAVFVRQHYHDFLNREPEPQGLSDWQNILNNCPAGSTACDRIEVSSAFFRSSEFQERGYFIYRFYSASLGRIPQFTEFVRDMSRLSGFQTAAEQEANKVAFVNEFMSRTEFRNRYDSQTTPTAYVDTLLQVAGLQSHPSRNTWIQGLTNGSLTRAQVLRQLAESSEVYNKFYNEAFVVMQYFGYLRRNPDILYLNWIDTLNRTGSYRDMVNGFVNSQEYRQRFGQ